MLSKKILSTIEEELDFSVIGRNRDRDRDRDSDRGCDGTGMAAFPCELSANESDFEF